jgi:hypothetical protein
MYRNIHSELWSDPEIKKALKDKNRDLVALFLWFITNELSHLSGIYSADKFIVMGKLNFTEPELDTLLSTLSESNLVFYDPDFEVVFVRTMFKHQGKGERNELSAAKQLESLHGCPLIALFLETYPHIKSRVTDTLLDRVKKHGSTLPFCSVSVSDTALKGKTPKATKRKILVSPEYSEQFAKFWEMYPRKTDKKDAYETWVGGKLDKKIELVIAKLNPYLLEVKDTEKRFIKHPKSWLNAQDWDDTNVSEPSNPDKKESLEEKQARLMNASVLIEDGKGGTMVMKI